MQGNGTQLLGWTAEARAAEWSLVLIAPFIGSFLGLLIRRLPEGSTIVRGRSRCDACGATLRVRDLVPIVSWLIVGARCRYCNQPLGWFYPGVEVAALAIALASVLIDGGLADGGLIDGGQGAWLDCVLGWWLLALAWIDLRSWLLPDSLTVPLIIGGLAAALLFNPDQLTERALGAALGYLSLMAIAALYRALRGRQGAGRCAPKSSFRPITGVEQPVMRTASSRRRAVADGIVRGSAGLAGVPTARGRDMSQKASCAPPRRASAAGASCASATVRPGWKKRRLNGTHLSP